MNINIKIYYSENRGGDAELLKEVLKDTKNITEYKKGKFKFSPQFLLYQTTNNYLILKLRRYHFLKKLTAQEFRLLKEEQFKVLERMLVHKTKLYTNLVFDYKTEQFFSLYKNSDIVVFYNIKEIHVYFPDAKEEEEEVVNQYMELEEVRIEKSIKLKFPPLEKIQKIIVDNFYRAKYSFII